MLELLLTAIRCGDTDAVLHYLQLVRAASLADFLTRVDSKGYSMLHYLARYNQVAALQWLYGRVPSSLFTMPIQDTTPFQMAVRGNAREVVAWFEAENINHFKEEKTRKVFNQELIRSPDDESILLDGHSDLVVAVAVGNLKATMVLLSEFLNIPLIIEDKQLRCDRIFGFLEQAIEHQHLDLLSYIAKQQDCNLEQRLSWLTDGFRSQLGLGTALTTLQYIEEYHKDPYVTIRQLFPQQDLLLRNKLIEMAALDACGKILQGLLAEYTALDDKKYEIINKIMAIAVAMYTAQIPNIRSHMDVLDIVTKVCLPDLNQNPALLANILYAPVRNNQTYVVDGILRRMSGDAKSAAFTHPYPEGGIFYSYECEISTTELKQTTGLTLVDIAINYKSFGILALFSIHGYVFNIEGLVERRAEAVSRRISAASSAKQKNQVDNLKNIKKILDSFPKEKINNIIAKKTNSYQLLFSQLITKIQDDGGKQELALVNMLLKLMDDPSKTLTIDGKLKLDGLWKAMLHVTQRDPSNFLGKELFRYLSVEIQKKGVDNTLFALSNNTHALAYGVLHGEYNLARKHLDYISAAIKVIGKEELLLEIALPHIILTRMSLIFCSNMMIDTPISIKKILGNLSRVDVFNIHTAVYLLQYAKPTELTTDSLKKIVQSFSWLEKDLMNYGAISYSQKFRESDSTKKMVVVTKVSVRIVYEWFLKFEKNIFPEGLQLLEISQKDHERAQAFLSLKFLVMRLLAKAISDLNAMALVVDPLFFEELNKHGDNADRVRNQIISLRENVFSEEIVGESRPAINPFIIQAIEQGNARMILELLQLMDDNLLRYHYQKGKTVADYLLRALIRNGAIEGFVFLLNRLEDIGIKDRLRFALQTAVAEDKANIVYYITHKKNYDFDNSFFASVYDGRFTKAINESHALLQDYSGRVPLYYAVLGGHRELVSKLLAAAPKQAYSMEKLVLCCLQTKHQYLLPLLMPLLSVAELKKILKNIMHIVHERYANRTEVLQEIMSHIPIELKQKFYKKIVLLAVQEGFSDTILELLSAFYGENQETNIHIAGYLFNYICYKFKELTDGPTLNRVVVLAGEKDHDESGNIDECKRINSNIKSACIIERLAEYMAKIFQDRPDVLNKILGLFIASNHDGGMRDLLANLPLATTSTAINYIQPQPNAISLLHTVIISEKTTFLYIFVLAGANLQAKLPANQNQTFKQFIASRHKMGSRVFFSDEVLNVERAVFSFTKALNDLRNGKELSIEQINATINASLSCKFRLRWSLYLDDLWGMIAWCCQYSIDKTRFESVFELAKSLMNVADGLRRKDYIRYANFAIALNKINEAIKYINCLEQSIYSGPDEHDPVIFAHVLTIKSVLLFVEAFKINIPHSLLSIYLKEWDYMSENQLICEGLLPHLEVTNVSLETLQALVGKLDRFNIPKNNKLDNKTQNEKDTNAISVLEIDNENVSLFKMILAIEEYLLLNKSNSKEDVIVNKEMLRLFYYVAYKMVSAIKCSNNYLVAASTKNLKLVLAKPIEDFIKKCETERFTLSDELLQDQSPDSKGKNYLRQKDKHTKKKESSSDVKTGEVANTIKPKIKILRTYISPEELAKDFPPLTYTEMPRAAIKQPKEMVVVKKIKENDKIENEATPINQADFPDLPKVKSSTTLAAINKMAEASQSSSQFLPTIMNEIEQSKHSLSPPFDCLPTKIVQLMIECGKTEEGDWKLIITGGTIFDCLTKGELGNDIDLVYYGSPTELKEFLYNKFGEKCVAEAGNNKQCWSVKIGEIAVDFTCILPNATLDENLQKIISEHYSYVSITTQFDKDLLVNALGRNFRSKSIYLCPDGTIIDPLNGMQDIKGHDIRLVANDPKTFLNYPIRAFQAMLFRQASGHKFAKCTAQAMECFIKEIDNIIFHITKDQLQKVIDKFIRLLGSAEAVNAELHAYGALRAVDRRLNNKVYEEQEAQTMTLVTAMTK